jgi:hypothetical protein
MADYFLQGLQVGANIGNMRAARQERMMELRAQEAYRAVQERQLNNEAEMIRQRAKIYEQELKDKEDAARQEKAFSAAIQPTLQQKLKESVDETGKPNRAKAVADTGTVLSAIDVGLATKWMTGQAQMMGAEADMERAQNAGKGAGSFTPVIEGVVNPLTNEKIPVLRTGPNSSQMVESKEKPDDVGQAFSLYKAAQASGNEELAAYHKAHLAKLTQATGMTVKTNPDGSVEIVQGPMADPDTLTKQNQSKVQEAQSKALDTVDTAERLLPLLTKETVGLEAFAKSWINDRILAQRYPWLASSNRAQASQLVSQLRADTVKAFRSDGNISEPERKEILSSFPKANDPVDSPARARMVVQQTQVMSAIQVVAATKRLGGEMPRAAALVLDDENVADMAKRGVISTDLAQKIWKLKRQ